MDVNRLLSDELSYELSVRGAPPIGSVAEKRQRLRGLIRLEKLGNTPLNSATNLDYKTELNICTLKLDELQSAVDRFEFDNASNENSRIQSRLVHVMGRLNRVVSPEAVDVKGELLTRCGRISEFLEEAMSLVQRCEPAAADIQRSILDEPIELLPMVNQNNTIQSQQIQATPAGDVSLIDFVEVDTSRRESTNGPPVTSRADHPTPSQSLEELKRRFGTGNTHSQENFHGSRSRNALANSTFTAGGSNDRRVSFAEESIELFSQWDIRLESSSDVEGFIERVEELRIVCGLSDNQLMGSLITLFKGPALEWYPCQRIENSQVFAPNTRAGPSNQTSETNFAYNNRRPMIHAVDRQMSADVGNAANSTPIYPVTENQPPPRVFRSAGPQLGGAVQPAFNNASLLDPKLKFSLDYVLASVIGDERPYLNVNIFGKDFLGLLDSGASKTILGGKGYNQFKQFHLNLIPTSIKTCSIANGAPCSVIGSYSIPFCVQNVVRVVEVLVIPSLPHLLILGSDFWRKLGIVPDLRHGLWHFSDSGDVHVDSITDKVQLTSEQFQELDNLIQEVVATTPEELERATAFSRIFKDVRRRLDQALTRSQKTYNLRRRDVKYVVGQRVWRRNYVLSDAARYFTAKLAPKFVGPFIIHRRVSPWTYELRDPDGTLRGVWNVKDLKPDTSDVD
ncbi:hypothetical protein NQ314_006554 [Rhamnusium bicolor]|uniref:Retropepsins domain-containing protein n=1 Tax=Rhamnusium bicolor TaxID=1586634 RepID=A0AAV8Z0E4_9CUCU|nr:hypothetical protein NQ314_006554 [Rhamnusium bicolor]